MTAVPPALPLPAQPAPTPPPAAAPQSGTAAAAMPVPPLWILAPTRPAHRLESVEIVARMSRRAVKVRIWRLDGIRGARPTYSIFVVDAFRLRPPQGCSEAEGQRLMAAAPWQGAGRDPLTAAPAARPASGGLPL